MTQGIINSTRNAFLTLLLASAVNCALAQWNTHTFTSSPNAEIPDGNPVGWLGHLEVSGLEGPIGTVKVNLDIIGGYNGDLYAFLSGPQGTKSVLLNRPGITGADPFGYPDAGLNITLDPGALNNVHAYGVDYEVNGAGQVVGVWGADGRDIDPQSPGLNFDLAPLTAGLDHFTGLPGTALNGAWSLFIVDAAGGGGSPVLESFGIEVTTMIPEPQISVLSLAAGLVALWRRGARRRR
jgi:subtilisin-like proprotein convertase family protein